MRARSSKTASRDRYYLALRAVWLGGECEGTVAGCRGRATEVHHKAGRGRYVMLNVSTWLAVCGPCHQWIESNGSQAKARGWKLSRDRRYDPHPNQLARCKACGEPVWWAWSITDQSVPLLADDNGPVGWDGPGPFWQEHHRQTSLTDQETDVIVVDSVRSKNDLDPDLPVWKSHLAVCRAA